MKKSLWLSIIILLTACTTIQPEPTTTLSPTETPIPSTATPSPSATPTETPIPLVDFSGSLFFDYNGSGLWDEGEPPIAGFGVCAKADQQDWSCKISDEQGNFIFESISPEGEQVRLKFEDPNADNPALAFRYLNLWHGPVVIKAYEINGAQVPEQHLSDTEILRIDETVNFEVGDEIELGLMQGFLTLPFIESQVPNVFVWNYFDIIGSRLFNDEITYDDTRDNVRLSYDGRFSSEATPDELRRLMNLEQIPGVSDSHTGLDFLLPVGNYIVSGAPASHVWYLATADKVHLMLLYPDNLNSNYETVYTHLNTPLVKLNQKIHRGQIVGISGDSSTDQWQIPQLHFHLARGTQKGWHYIDPFRCTVEFDTEPENYWGSRFSWWTKDNDPQFP